MTWMGAVQSLTPPLNWKVGFGSCFDKSWRLLESTACAHLQTGNIFSAGRESSKREIESGARGELMYAAVVPTSCRETQRVMFPALTSDSRLHSLGFLTVILSLLIGGNYCSCYQRPPIQPSVTAAPADSASSPTKVWTNGCWIDSSPPAIFGINACPPHYRSRLPSPWT